MHITDDIKKKIQTKRTENEKEAIEKIRGLESRGKIKLKKKQNQNVLIIPRWTVFGIFLTRQRESMCEKGKKIISFLCY